VIPTDPVTGLLSVTIDQNIYLTSAAHPSDQVDAYTFDMSNGNHVGLSDMFQGNYLKTLSSYSMGALTHMLGSDADSGQIAQGTTPTSDNFVVFVPHADGVHIIFNQYQVASYAAGIQEITIPYATLKADIKSNGPLRQFAK